jgi:hypothetical protein
MQGSYGKLWEDYWNVPRYYTNVITEVLEDPVTSNIKEDEWFWRTKQKYTLKRGSGERDRSILWNVTLENGTEVYSETWLWRTEQEYTLKRDSGERNRRLLWNVGTFLSDNTTSQSITKSSIKYIL